MARVRPLEREDLPAEHRHIYDDIAGSRGGVQPNFKALLNTRWRLPGWRPWGVCSI